jgi:hypothetical protein
MLTVEIFKKDGRVKSDDGLRFVAKHDYSTSFRDIVESIVSKRFPESKGYVLKIYDTYVIRKHALTGVEFQERYDTPYYCSPSSESYFTS